MPQPTEIILFHVDDPDPAMFSGDARHDILFSLCVRSIRHFSPNSKITLLTDEKTRISDPYPDVETIRAPVRTDWIMYERSRLYKDHVNRRYTEKSKHGLAFLDTDVLVTRDLAPIFDLEFDVALTTRLKLGIVLNEHGVHDETKTHAPINGGVLFAKPTAGAVLFFNEHIRIYDHLHDEAKMTFRQGGAPKDIRKWGGDQFAYMAMVGKALIENQPSTTSYKDALVRFFPCDTHNYSPDLNQAVTYEQLIEKYVVHMKGPRKVFMPAVAKMLKIV